MIKKNTILILKDGKGKEYYEKKTLKFTGEYFDGKRWMESYMIISYILSMK